MPSRARAAGSLSVRAVQPEPCLVRGVRVALGAPAAALTGEPALRGPARAAVPSLAVPAPAAC
ncbi:hypothetical protein GCM10010129_55880 [Streptomyces fumigatiscleroticus]|nr:hypothetical protein GCM10010129_55880 [Streptomyces fumigatiscleroticus]